MCIGDVPRKLILKDACKVLLVRFLWVSGQTDNFKTAQNYPYSHELSTVTLKQQISLSSTVNHNVLVVS